MQALIVSKWPNLVSTFCVVAVLLVSPNAQQVNIVTCSCLWCTSKKFTWDNSQHNYVYGSCCINCDISLCHPLLKRCLYIITAQGVLATLSQMAVGTVTAAWRCANSGLAKVGSFLPNLMWLLPTWGSHVAHVESGALLPVGVHFYTCMHRCWDLMFARLTLFLLRSGTLYDRHTYLSMESQDLHKSFSSTLTPVEAHTPTHCPWLFVELF